MAGSTPRARRSQRTSLVPRSTGASHAAETRSCGSGRLTTSGPESVSTFHTSHDTPPVSGSSATSPSPTSPAPRNPSMMTASTVTSQLLADPRTDEVGGVLPLFDRILEIMRAGDQFELLVARPQEIEDLARVARKNARVGRPLHDERGGVVLGEMRLPLDRKSVV